MDRQTIKKTALPIQSFFILQMPVVGYMQSDVSQSDIQL